MTFSQAVLCIVFAEISIVLLICGLWFIRKDDFFRKTKNSRRCLVASLAFLAAAYACSRSHLIFPGGLIVDLATVRSSLDRRLQSPPPSIAWVAFLAPAALLLVFASIRYLTEWWRNARTK
jgi:hypothetical protein